MLPPGKSLIVLFDEGDRHKGADYTELLRNHYRIFSYVISLCLRVSVVNFTTETQRHRDELETLINKQVSANVLHSSCTGRFG
jgi:hypothetical protein